MSSKFSLLPILTGQLATLVDAKTGRPRFEDYVVLVGLPLGAALAVWQQEWRLASVSELIAGVSILTAFLFGLAIYVFQLRVQLGSELNRAATSATVRLVDELFSNTCWAIVVGITLTASAIVCAMSQTPLEGGGAAPLGTAGTAVLVFLSVHLLGMLAMCLKRLNSAFSRLNN